MGNQFTVSSERPKAGYLDDWETIDHLGNYNLVRNIKSGDLGQSKKYRLDSLYDPKDQIQIYEKRRQAGEPIVKAYSYQILEKVSKRFRKQQDVAGVCASNNYLGVVTEHIPITLYNLGNLQFIEYLYILSKSLKGFQYLFPKTGAVNVTPEMIGLNSKGQLKVWINQDFSKNHPVQQIPSLLTTRNLNFNLNQNTNGYHQHQHQQKHKHSHQNQNQKQYTYIQPQYRQEKQFVQNIVDVVERKCQFNGLPEQFAREIRINLDSFVKVLWYIDHFCQKYRIQRPINLLPRLLEYQEKGKHFITQQLSQKPYEIHSFTQTSYPHQHLSSFSTGNITNTRNQGLPQLHTIIATSQNRSLQNNNEIVKTINNPISYNSTILNDEARTSHNKSLTFIPNQLVFPSGSTNTNGDIKFQLNSSPTISHNQKYGNMNDSLREQRIQTGYDENKLIQRQEYVPPYPYPQPLTINDSRKSSSAAMIKFNYKN